MSEDPAAHENCVHQLKELIFQNFNHSSICFWGISNEILIGGISEQLVKNHVALNALATSAGTAANTLTMNHGLTSITPNIPISVWGFPSTAAKVFSPITVQILPARIIRRNIRRCTMSIWQKF